MALNQAEFRSRVMQARIMQGLGERTAYWEGYERGLRRAFLGELSVSDGENSWLWAAADSSDSNERERGVGYREALNH
jgi:hypothetical protein